MSRFSIFLIVRHNPTCFAPLSAHHQGYPQLLLLAATWFMRFLA